MWPSRVHRASGLLVAIAVIAGCATIPITGRKSLNLIPMEQELSLIRGDATVNAFCLPGGKVAVYTGILKVSGNEAGLATVMSHGIAHAIARHGGREDDGSTHHADRRSGIGSTAQDESPSTHPGHGQRVKDLEKWMPEAIAEYEKSKR